MVVVESIHCTRRQPSKNPIHVWLFFSSLAESNLVNEKQWLLATWSIILRITCHIGDYCQFEKMTPISLKISYADNKVSRRLYNGIIFPKTSYASFIDLMMSEKNSWTITQISFCFYIWKLSLRASAGIPIPLQKLNYVQQCLLKWEKRQCCWSEKKDDVLFLCNNPSNQVAQYLNPFLGEMQLYSFQGLWNDLKSQLFHSSFFCCLKLKFVDQGNIAQKKKKTNKKQLRYNSCIGDRNNFNGKQQKREWRMYCP